MKSSPHSPRGAVNEEDIIVLVKFRKVYAIFMVITLGEINGIIQY